MPEQPPKISFKSFVITPPVRRQMEEAARTAPPQLIPVIISLHESKAKPVEGVRHSKEVIRAFLEEQGVQVTESDFYLFGRLTADQIQGLAEQTEWVRLIWKDETCYAHLLESTATVKAPASWMTFEARGKGITWAVMDSGIKADHPHFTTHDTIDLELSWPPPQTDSAEDKAAQAKMLDDRHGHGTHVAGVIAGASSPRPDHRSYKAATLVEGREDPSMIELPGCPSGVAPLAKIINVKVLDENGTGSASTAIRGLEYLRKLNEKSREIKVDGVNMSLGYPFDPQWYGCGHSPLCEEVTRSVRSGLIVVVSCGNAGYGNATLNTGQVVPVYINLSIADPANAEDAIAVGSVHKSAPHTYGISYFSSKGPTGDGRMKPDLVAPGEKIISCAIHVDRGCEYREDSGTSMAAPHVSGAIAAFLSAHPEFRGNPFKVKDIFMKTAVDLGRDRAFQGAGLVDLLRALMSV